MFLIKEATEEDVQTICQMAEDTWWPTYSPMLEREQIRFMLDEIYSPQKIQQQIESGCQFYLLLIENERPVAFTSYSPRKEDQEIYKLHKLYCLPETQGKGYGKILIDEVSKKVKELGIHTLDLNVNRNNPAKTFYEKMGFNVIYEEDIPIGKYWMNDYATITACLSGNPFCCPESKAVRYSPYEEDISLANIG